MEEVTLIAGQKAVHHKKAKKSIAGFKLREGMPIGVTVDLEARPGSVGFPGQTVQCGLSRVRDFRGLSEQGLRRNGELHTSG